MQLKHRIIFSTDLFGTRFAINFLYHCFIQITSYFVNRRFTALGLFLLFTTPILAQHQLSMSKDERLYQKGNELIAHANYGAAREVFSDFLKITPSTDSRR